MGERTSTQRLRCSVFLLQLLSTILKSQRGASHPERSKHASAPLVADITADCTKDKFAASDETHCEWEKEAARLCAKVANTYIDRMIRATTALTVGRRNVDPFKDYVSESLGVADIGFWVFALSSDVLKHLRNSKWSYAHSISLMRCKRQRDGETRVLVPDSEAAGANDDGCASHRKVVSDVLDIPGLAEAVSAFPVGRSAGTMDAALKWLEVTQASNFCSKHLSLDVDCSGSFSTCDTECQLYMNRVSVSL